MPRRATLRLLPLQTCLVNLPLSVYGQLVSRGVTPQSVVVCLAPGNASSRGSDSQHKNTNVAQKLAYVGWSGMPSRVVGGAAAIAAKSNETVEMDPVCALELGLRDGQEVSIDLLRNLPAAASVSVEPVTADDWEIVELHAEFIEQNLLSQIRAASPEQQLCAWVGKAKTLVRLRVVSVDPSEDIAVRLTIDTEVVIAPKSRMTSSSTAIASQKHDLGSPAPHSSSTSKHRKQPKDVLSAKKQLLRVLPIDITPEAYETLDGPTAWVHPHRWRLLTIAYPSTKVELRHVQCPHDTNDQQKSTASSEAANTAIESNDRPSGVDAQTHGSALSDGITNARLLASSDVPRNGIRLNMPARQRIKTGELDFELVIINAAKTSTVSTEATPNGHVEAVPEAKAMSQPPFAGFELHLDHYIQHIRRSISANAAFNERARRPCPGLLICGASGSGKTVLVERGMQALRHDTRTLTWTTRIRCSSLTSLRIPQLQSRLRDILKSAAWHAPSVVLFDDLDILAPAEVEHIDSAHSQQIANIFINTINEEIRDLPIVVVATCRNPESLHAALSQNHLFGERILLKVPDKAGRAAIFESWLKAKLLMTDDLIVAPDLNYAAIASQTEGYLPADLRDLVDRIVQQSTIRTMKSSREEPRANSEYHHMAVSMQDVNAAQNDYVPLTLRDVKLQKSETQWADIGGLQETRRVLRETLEWPTKYSAIFASSPLRLRSGLLLYGYPGCGKTLLASAVAKECGLNFISVKGPEILNKYIGASEKSVRDLFERAQAARPCVLFFDEFDSIAPKRGHDSTGVTDRVVNQMLTQMDGAEGLEGVYVLAATSRPDLIDPALLRPGRLDKSLLCDMPNAQDRLEIMQACARKIALAPDVNLSGYIDSTRGYSGADLQAVIYNAHLECIHEKISAAEQRQTSALEPEATETPFITFGASKQSPAQSVRSRADAAKFARTLGQILSHESTATNTRSDAQMMSETNLVEAHHLKTSLQTTRPSVPSDEIARLRRTYEDFVSARERSQGGLPDGAASNQIGGRTSLM